MRGGGWTYGAALCRVSYRTGQKPSSRGSDIGKYTGFYYTASMAAQVATPMLSGFLMDRAGMTVLFPYAVIFVALAFVTMCFVRHGDSRPEAKKGLEALEDLDN